MGEGGRKGGMSLLLGEVLLSGRGGVAGRAVSSDGNRHRRGKASDEDGHSLRKGVAKMRLASLTSLVSSPTSNSNTLICHLSA